VSLTTNPTHYGVCAPLAVDQIHIARTQLGHEVVKERIKVVGQDARPELLHGGGHRLPLRVAEILYRARARSSDPAGEPSRCAELVVAVYLADPTRPDAATRDVGAVQHLGLHVVMRAVLCRSPATAGRLIRHHTSPLQLSHIPHVYMAVHQCVVAAQ
jgi:hypothetical protein